MQKPIALGIEVFDQSRIGFDAGRAELRYEVTHTQPALAERLRDFAARITMVHRAERFESSSAFRGNATGIVANGGIDQRSQKSGAHIGQVAGNEQDPAGSFAGRFEGGMQSGHWSATWDNVGQDSRSEMSVSNWIAEERHRSRGLENLRGDRLDERPACDAVVEQRLVLTHTAAAATRQDEARDSGGFEHARIITLGAVRQTPWFPSSLRVY
jgi:hypothetical protein